MTYKFNFFPITPTIEILARNKTTAFLVLLIKVKMGIWDKVISAWKGDETDSTATSTGKKYDFDGIVTLVKTKPSNVVLLDVREPSEFSVVQIPGSHNIPYKSAPDALALPAEEFQAKFGFSKPAKDAELVVFCAAGRRAEGAQGKAVANGYTNVSIYPGSMNDWVAKGGDKIQW